MPRLPRRGRRTVALLAAVVALPPLSRQAAAQPGDRGLAIVDRPSANVAADAGRTVTLTAVLANATAAPVEVTAAVALPPRWRLLTTTDRLVVPAAGRATWVGTAVVPSGADAGRYTLRATYGTAQQPGPVLHDSMVVTVAGRTAIALRVITPLTAIVAGEGAQALVRIENRGNVRGTIELELSGQLARPDAPAEPVPVRANVPTLTLAPGSAQTVQLSLETPRTLARVTPLTVEVLARMAGRRRGDDGAAGDTLRTIVVPDGTAPDARARWLPARAVLRLGTRGSGLPVEIVGSGAFGNGVSALAGGSATVIDVVLRGPGRSAGLMGGALERGEYRVAVHSRAGRLTLGDQLVSLSTLSEPGRYAFGATGRATLGPVTVDALGARDGASLAQGAVAGVGLTGNVARGLELGTFGVRRTGSGAGTVGTARARFAPDSSFHLTLESGLGAATASPGAAPRSGAATHAELVVDRPRVTASLRHSARGSGFPGELRGTREDGASTRLRLVGRLRLDARISRTTVAGGALPSYVLQQLTADTALRASPEAPPDAGTAGSAADPAQAILRMPAERRVESEVGAALGDAFGVALVAADRVGTSGMLAYDGGERRVRVQAAGAAGPVRLAGSGELGVVLDRRKGTVGTVRRAAASIGVQPSAGVWASAYADARQGPTLWSGPATTLNAGLDARVPLGRSTALRVNGGMSDQRSLLDGLVPIATRVRVTRLDASVERALRKARTLTLRARHDAFRGSWGARSALGGRTLALEYGMPLPLPVWRAPRTTQVSTRLVEHETGRPIARALVQLDDDPQAIAMSDAAGRVRFRGVQAGTHRLTLLDARATTGRIASNAASLLLTAGEHVADASLRLVRGARLRGAVCRTSDEAAARALSRQAVGDVSNATRGPAGDDPVSPPDAPAPGDGAVDVAPGAAPVGCADDVGVADAVVTLASGSDTLQVVTDARGTFVATGLRPGQWALKVANAQLPSGLAFSDASHQVEVAAGGDATAALRATPRRRTFRTLQVVVAPSAPPDASSGPRQ